MIIYVFHSSIAYTQSCSGTLALILYIVMPSTKDIVSGKMELTMTHTFGLCNRPL